VLWLRLVLLFRLATLLPSSYLPRQFFFILKRFWVLLRSRDWLKYPLFPFLFFMLICFILAHFSHACISFLPSFSFPFVLHVFLSFSFLFAHIFTVFSLAIFHCFSYKLGGCVSPDILLHPATYQCTGCTIIAALSCKDKRAS
jgi:hypothetical protein